MTHDSFAPPQGGGGHDGSTHGAVETAKTEALKQRHRSSLARR